MKQQTPWTVEAIIMLRELLEQRPTLTYSDIADRMTKKLRAPFTKNSCIGRARRLGTAKRQQVKIKRNGRPVRSRPRVPKLRLSPRLKLAPPSPPSRISGALKIEQLAHGDCRWPEGNRAPFLFCGEQVLDNCSYCLKHALISYPAMRKTA